MPATLPDEIAKALAAGGPAPAGLSADETARVGSARLLLQERPRLRAGDGAAVRRRCTASRIRRSAWPRGCSTTTPPATRSSRASSTAQTEGLTRDDILDNVTLYWLTNTAVSSARLYWESKLAFFAPKGVTLPTAVSVFPDEIYAAPQQLGGAGVSEPDPLQPAPQGRALSRPGSSRSRSRRRCGRPSRHCAESRRGGEHRACAVIETP